MCALTAVVVVVAIRRLALYQDVYGLTMLRLYCTLFAVWIGVVLLLLATWLNGVRPNHGWFPTAAAAGGLVLLFGLNVANPEAIVAQTNLQRQTPVPVDNQYLTELSDDAVPTIIEAASGLDDDAAAEVRDQLCSPYMEYGRSSDSERYTGWAAWNLSDQLADTEIEEFCQSAFQ